jgi:hypothetical protein
VRAIWRPLAERPASPPTDGGTGPGRPGVARSSAAGPRPVTPAYNDISRVIYTTIHPTRSIDPEGNVETLEEKVGQAVRSEGLL